MPSWFYFVFFFFNFGGSSLPWPGIEPELAAMKVPNPNHRTAREFPAQLIFDKDAKAI